MISWRASKSLMLKKLISNEILKKNKRFIVIRIEYLKSIVFLHQLAYAKIIMDISVCDKDPLCTWIVVRLLDVTKILCTIRRW